MKKRLTILMIGIMALGMLNFGCKKDKDDSSDSALPKEVTNFVPESILNEIKRLGMPINEGNTPPNIEFTFMARPLYLKASNRPGDLIGQQFANFKVKFYEQNNEKRFIKCDYVNGTAVGTGLGSYVSGTGSLFTVFSEMDVTIGIEKIKLVQVISGTIVDGGIKDFYYANFMIDNNGNPGKSLLENGQGRIFYDKDGMSEKVLKSGFIAEDDFINLNVNSIPQ